MIRVGREKVRFVDLSVLKAPVEAVGEVKTSDSPVGTVSDAVEDVEGVGDVVAPDTGGTSESVGDVVVDDVRVDDSPVEAVSKPKGRPRRGR